VLMAQHLKEINDLVIQQLQTTIQRVERDVNAVTSRIDSLQKSLEDRSDAGLIASFPSEIRTLVGKNDARLATLEKTRWIWIGASAAVSLMIAWLFHIPVGSFLLHLFG
jgi:hypothetical protein